MKPPLNLCSGLGEGIDGGEDAHKCHNAKCDDRNGQYGTEVMTAYRINGLADIFNDMLFHGLPKLINSVFSAFYNSRQSFYDRGEIVPVYPEISTFGRAKALIEPGQVRVVASVKVKKY